MAKQAVSPVERHLEKGVLGLALLVLAGVVVKFLITSPNNIVDLAGRTVTPGEVYQALAADAEQLRNRVKNKKIEDKPTKDYTDELAKLWDVKPGPLPLAVAWGPPVPDLSAAKMEEGNIELVSVLELSKPVVQVGRSGAELVPPQPVSAMPDELKEETLDPQYVVPVNWVTVSATFDVDAQRQLAEAKKYLRGQQIPYLVGAELQRREKNWDGTYTDWETVKTYARWELPELPFVEIEEKDGKPIIPDTMQAKVDAFRNAVQTGWWRLNLIRPLPPRVTYGEWWDPPQGEGLELLRMDDEVLNPPPDTPACPYYDRYPKKPKVKLGRGSSAADLEKAMREDLERRCAEIEAWTKQGCVLAASESVKDLLRNSGQKIEELDPKKSKWLQEQDDALDKLVAKAKKDEDDIKSGKKPPPPPRELLPQQVVWVHDAVQNSVASGKIYQYRMRPLLFNNLLGQAMQLKNPKDAEIVLLPGEWSKESDEVTIPSDTEFFLVSGKEDKKTIRIEVFKWHEGEWLRSQFEVGVGDRIGGRASVKIGNAAPTRIEFSTGARVVDLRFDYPYRERKEKKGSWDFGEAKPTLAMVYVDGQGDVHQRLLEEDKRDPRRRELSEALAGAGPPGGP